MVRTAEAPVAQPPAEAPAAPPVPSHPGEALGISKEAFEAASAAMKEVSEGIEPGEAEGDALQSLPDAPDAPAETPAAPPAAATPPAPPPSEAQGWAAIKKREQQAVEHSRRLKAFEADLKRREEALSGKEKTAADIIADLKKDPRTLEKYGLTLKEFLDRILQDGAPVEATKTREQDEKYSALEKQISELKTALQRRQVVDAETQFRSGFSQVLAHPDFELLNSHPAIHDEALKFAGAYYEQYGKMDLTHEQIARHLLGTWQEHIDSLSSSKAVRKRLGLPETPAARGNEIPEPPAPSRTPAPQAKPNTVTPGMGASPARGTPISKVSRRSDEDVVAEAAKLVPKDVWDQID